MRDLFRCAQYYRPKTMPPALWLLIALQLALLSVSGCVDLGFSVAPTPAPVTLQAQYSSALNDARIVTRARISPKLVAITNDNSDLTWENNVVGSRVLVATIMGDAGEYYKCNAPAGCIGNTEGKEGGEHTSYRWDTWVTVVPELKGFFRQTRYSPLRLAQLMGFPINYATPGDPREAKYVVEMWASPKDIFRPCPDSEISDSACETDFPVDMFRTIDPAKKVEASEGLTTPVFKTYTSWFNNRRRNIYKNTTASPAFPWTGLGYTYDWGSGNHFGLSEFVLHGKRENGTISVGIKSVKTLRDYLD